MQSTLRYFIIFFLAMGLSACKKPIPDPENLDPIYRHLKGLAEERRKTLEEALKKKEDAYKNYEKQAPNTVDKKLARREYEKWESQINKLEQDAHYFKIRAERRKTEDKVNYMEAFRADKPWPPADEYSAFLTNRRLAEAPTTWGKDLPKLYDSPAAKKVEKKAE